MQIQEQTSQCLTQTSVSCSKPPQSFQFKLGEFPFCHLSFNPRQSTDKLVAHCKGIFHAFDFVSKFMGLYQQALDEKVRELSECLQQPSNMWQYQKTLFIDIDETLLTRISHPIEGSETIMIAGKQIHFKIRPYAFEFLTQMQCHYDLVLFSASEDSYSKTFFEYFNSRVGNGIRQYLSRDFCIQVYKNIYFKDLRIIQSRNLKDMILVDNSAFSFGSLIENGVPIMTYDCSEDDQELQYLKDYLIEASKSQDVRVFNRERLRLREMMKIIGD